ncbi:MAG: hypothetical protein FJ221_17235 [Lentisphaerae bacterium]|nr:hypothetical protein [Lentisphaerota bacterium]
MKHPHLLLALLLLATALKAEVVIYPDPGDLGGFQNLRKSERYAVTVNGKRTTVYASNNRTGKDVDGRDIPKGYITDAQFCYFSFTNEAVTVDVSSPDGKGISHASLHPERLGIKAGVSDGRVRFTMDQPRKIVLKTSDEELHPLVILADAPDTDIPTGPDVTRFGPGIHDIGFQRPIRDGETIYIDGGAVVKGTLRKPKEDGPLKNFTLRGRGIIYGGDNEFIARGKGWGRGITAWERGLYSGRIEGCILLDSVHWNMGFGNHNSTFKNLKIISFYGNTDGVRVGPGSTCRDCFVMTNDDALLPEGTGAGAIIEDSVIWHHKWGNPFKIINIGGEQTGGTHDVTFRNIDVLTTGSPVFLSPHEHRPDTYTFAKKQAPTRNILFENIYVERAKTLFQLRPPIGSVLSHVTIRNLHTPVATGIIDGWSPDVRVEDLTIEGLVVGGRPVRSLKETQIKVGKHTARIILK